MTKKDMIDIIYRLNHRRTRLWQFLVKTNISDSLAKKLSSEVRKLDGRIFTLQCKLISVDD